MAHKFLMLLAIALFAGCSATPSKSPDVADSIHKSLDQARFKDVSVSQDRDKGVVTLSGHVPTDGDKAQAESMTKALAAGQVVANEIAVLPPGGEGDAKTVTSALDQGIEKNLDAVLIQQGLRSGVKYSVTTGVVTLTGEVTSQGTRGQVEKVASSVPDVKQVVNELPGEKPKGHVA